MANNATEVKAQFRAEGISIAQWARAHRFSEVMTYRVLAGKVKCTRGEAHKIAVALGLKTEPDVPHFNRDTAA